MTWPTAPLSSVAQVIRGVTFKPGDVTGPEEKGAIAVFRTKNIQADLDLSDTWGLPARFADTGRLLQAGDLLISTANSAHLVGKVCWVPHLPWPAVPGGFIGALRAENAKLDARYLYWWAKTPSAQTSIRACANQTTNIANLSIPRLMAVEMPLPPLDEQRRIAEILDQADLLRRDKSRTVSRLDDLAQSAFREIIGDPLTNSLGWRDEQRLGQVAEIASGITKGRRLNGAPTRAIPYLAVANVQDRFLALGNVKEIEATEEEVARYRLRRNDLLLTEGGDPDKLGRGALWKEELPEAIHQNHVFRVRLTSSELIPIFLNWLIGSSRGKRYFLRSAKQTTGIASINMGQLKQFPLLVPPLEVQERFATAIATVEKQTAIGLRSLDRLNGLFASLQHRAFTGQLTRADEGLLETA